MQRKMFHCRRCGVYGRGWNQRYLQHRLHCQQWLHKSGIAGAALVIALIVVFPTTSESLPPAPQQTVAVEEAAVVPVVIDPAVEAAEEARKMEAFLKRHHVSDSKRERLAESIVASAKKHQLNPKLVASIVIIESRGNPFAISGADAVGVMQIHLPTWGETADRENINLLKIEDNIDFGARILKEYVTRFGISEGVRRYNGFIPGNPSLEESSARYVAKIREVFDFGDSPRL